MTTQRPLLAVLATCLALSLACGGIATGEEPSAAASEDGAPTQVAASQPVQAAPMGDPLVTQCTKAIACGCPNNPGDTVDSCVTKWGELMAWGTQASTIGCFAQLDCQSMCDISTGPGQRCLMLMQEDANIAQSTIDQRMHETTMQIIGDAERGVRRTEVYDENGNKRYEY